MRMLRNPNDYSSCGSAGVLVPFITAVTEFRRSLILSGLCALEGRQRLQKPNADAHETSCVAQAYVRGGSNILNRVLIHTAALDLTIFLRALARIVTPTSLQARLLALATHLL
jgi:hypothetical protein